MLLAFALFVLLMRRGSGHMLAHEVARAPVLFFLAAAAMLRAFVLFVLLGARRGRGVFMMLLVFAALAYSRTSGILRSGQGADSVRSWRRRIHAPPAWQRESGQRQAEESSEDQFSSFHAVTPLGLGFAGRGLYIKDESEARPNQSNGEAHSHRPTNRAELTDTRVFPGKLTMLRGNGALLTRRDSIAQDL